MPKNYLFKLLAVVAVLLTVGVGVTAASSGALSSSAQRTLVWVESQIGPDGAVLSPMTGEASVNYTMYAALGLASTDTHSAALDRALGYIGDHVEEWVVSSSIWDGPLGSDLPGRLGYLIMLVNARGGNPAAFGAPATDLVSRLQALDGVDTPGAYGTPNPYSSIIDQSLALLALVAVGETVPTASVEWLVDQQCVGDLIPPSAMGGWMAFRSSTGGVADPCEAPDSLNYLGADTNSTAFAVQALVAVGRTSPVADALGFLHAAQVTTGSMAGGFPWFTGGEADPNSTGVVIQAIIAAGESVTSAEWLAGGKSALQSLDAVTIQSGAEAGAIWYPTDPSHTPDLIATSQGLWGLSLAPFPFPVFQQTPATTVVVTEPLTPAFTG